MGVKPAAALAVVTDGRQGTDVDRDGRPVARRPDHRFRRDLSLEAAPVGNSVSRVGRRPRGHASTVWSRSHPAAIRGAIAGVRSRSGRERLSQQHHQHEDRVHSVLSFRSARPRRSVSPSTSPRASTRKTGDVRLSGFGLSPLAQHSVLKAQTGGRVCASKARARAKPPALAGAAVANCFNGGRLGRKGIRPWPCWGAEPSRKRRSFDSSVELAGREVGGRCNATPGIGGCLRNLGASCRGSASFAPGGSSPPTSMPRPDSPGGRA